MRLSNYKNTNKEDALERNHGLTDDTTTEEKEGNRNRGLNAHFSMCKQESVAYHFASAFIFNTSFTSGTINTSLAVGEGAICLHQPTEQFLSLPLPTLTRLWVDECQGLQEWHSMAIPMQIKTLSVASHKCIGC